MMRTALYDAAQVLLPRTQKWSWLWPIFAGERARTGQRDRHRFAQDSPLEGDGFELVWGFSCQVVVFGFCRFFVRSWKAVLRPVAWDQVRGARGRGQGTETVAKLGGLPPSVACVSQRLDA